MRRNKQTPEERAEYKRQWQRANRDKATAASRRYRARNRKQCAERAKLWRQANPEKLKIAKPKWHRKTTYGLEHDQFELLLAKQNGVCAICNKLPRDAKGFCVDHCHESGVVRGLLCNHCNRGLGLLGDSVEVLKRAIEYLLASGKD